MALFISVEAYAGTVGSVFANEELPEIPSTNDFRPENSGNPFGSNSGVIKPLGTNGEGFGEPDVTNPPKKNRPAATPKRDFTLKSKKFYGAYEKRSGYQWNGCDKNAAVQGGFGTSNRSKCANNKRTVFNTFFSKHLQEEFMPCIRQASRSAGLKAPKKVFLSLGTVFADRMRNNGGKSSKKSNHAYGTALDIFAFHLYDEKNNRTWISANKNKYGGQVSLFYNSFVSCWDKSVRHKCGQKSGTIIHTSAKKALKKRGEKFFANSLHADHIHLQFPNSCRK